MDYVFPITDYRLLITDYRLPITDYRLPITDYRSPVTAHQSSTLKEACQDFESIFLYFLLKQMRSTVPKTGFISGGKAEEVFQQMLDEELAKEMAKAGGIGLGKMLEEQFGRESRSQGVKKSTVHSP